MGRQEGVCWGGADRVSEVSLRGEQLDRGAATLPTLSSLSRIDDDARPHMRP